MKKKLAIFGSTGSIGTSTLKIVEHHPERFSVAALAAHGGNLPLLEAQVEQFQPQIVAVFDEIKAAELSKKFPRLRVVAGEAGLEEMAAQQEVDVAVMAIVGTAALKPTVRAIEAGKTIALANKEILVAAGELIRTLAKKNKVDLLPVDSEHSALFQCLEGRKMTDVRRLILTASGGPFRTFSKERLAGVQVEDALAHPTWKMGPKVTIDSSTLMNKGLEMIEAQVLFDLPPEKIDVVVHPQSVVHSMVEFIDGSMLAQMSEPSMIFPIQYALTYPERAEGLFPPFDFTKNEKLEFFAPDHSKFPALELVKGVMQEGGSAPCYMNAANEVLVARFLEKEISWSGIVERLDRLLSKHQTVRPRSIGEVLDVDGEARIQARTA